MKNKEEEEEEEERRKKKKIVQGHRRCPTDGSESIIFEFTNCRIRQHCRKARDQSAGVS